MQGHYTPGTLLGRTWLGASLGTSWGRSVALIGELWGQRLELCLGDLLSLPRPLRLNKLMSMKMLTMNTVRKTLTGTLVTVTTSWTKQHTLLVLRQMTDDPALLEQFNGNLEDAGRSFQEARELLSRVESARGY